MAHLLLLCCESRHLREPLHSQVRGVMPGWVREAIVVIFAAEVYVKLSPPAPPGSFGRCSTQSGSPCSTTGALKEERCSVRQTTCSIQGKVAPAAERGQVCPLPLLRQAVACVVVTPPRWRCTSQVMCGCGDVVSTQAATEACLDFSIHTPAACHNSLVKVEDGAAKVAGLPRFHLALAVVVKGTHQLLRKWAVPMSFNGGTLFNHVHMRALLYCSSQLRRNVPAHAGSIQVTGRAACKCPEP